MRIHDKDIGDTQELIEVVRGVARMCAVAARMRNVGVHSSLTFSKDFLRRVRHTWVRRK